MLNLVRLLPVILSLLLLAAHFYRAGNLIFLMLIVASPLLLFIKSPLVVRIIQIELLMGGLEWIRTLIRLVNIRQAHNLPWERLALILGIVAAFTMMSVLVFNVKQLKARYFSVQQDVRR